MGNKRHKYHEDGTRPFLGQVFVFGSNLDGRHGAGAAKVAAAKFGAVRGVGEGYQGRSYAIPTKDEDLRVLSLKRIRKAVKKFRQFTKQNPDLKFFVTRIGCGLAGYKDSDIAPMFRGATRRCNFPIEWEEYLEV